MMAELIAIEGNIGVGKTTLGEQLRKHLGVYVIFEPVDENKYLADFYKFPARWAFTMQMELLYQRYILHLKAQGYIGDIAKPNTVVVLDRSLIGDFVFARLNWELHNMNDLEWRTYRRFHDHLTLTIVMPTKIIYLNVEPEEAQRRLEMRARPQEMHGTDSRIPLSYYQRLEDTYRKVFGELGGAIEIISVDWNEPNKDISEVSDYVRAALGK